MPDDGEHTVIMAVQRYVIAAAEEKRAKRAMVVARSRMVADEIDARRAVYARPGRVLVVELLTGERFKVAFAGNRDLEVTPL